MGARLILRMRTNQNKPSFSTQSWSAAPGVGEADGEAEGRTVGSADGLLAGRGVELLDGVADGLPVGDGEGLLVGSRVGLGVGAGVGLVVGTGAGVGGFGPGEAAFATVAGPEFAPLLFVERLTASATART
jgi:hypothetical protein